MTPVILGLADKAVAFSVEAAFDSRFPNQTTLATKALKYAVTAIATAIFAKAGEAVSAKASTMYDTYMGKVHVETPHFQIEG